MIHRPSLSETWINVASQVAQRATCPRAQVGTVIVDSNDCIVSSGYNGSPEREPHCHERGCFLVHNHCVRAVHSEMNALLQAAKRGVSTRNCTLYCTLEPCLPCTTAIITAGISRIIYLNDYHIDNEEYALKQERIRQHNVVWLNKERV